MELLGNRTEVMTEVLTEPVTNAEADIKDQITNLYLSWPQMVVTLQILDAAAPVGLCHDADALRDFKVFMITDALPETPAAAAGLCAGDVVEKIGSHDAVTFILEGGKMGAAAEDDGTLALTLRRAEGEVPVADAPVAVAKVAEVPAGRRVKKMLEADLAPTPLRIRNCAPCKREESVAPRRAEEPLCRRCGIHAVSKRKALQKNNLCCNKCPNHGPWCTMHDQSTCREDAACKISAVVSVVHEQRACEKDVGTKVSEVEVEHEDREEEETYEIQQQETRMRSLLTVIEDPAEKRRKADEQKRLKAEEAKCLKVEEKRLADEEKRLKVEEKRQKAEEEKRMKVEEKRLKAEMDAAGVEAAAALRKIQQAGDLERKQQKKMCDLERKQQDKRKREEEKAIVADMRKRVKMMSNAMTKGLSTEKTAAEKAAAEENLAAEKAPTVEAVAEVAAAEQATAEERIAEQTALEDTEMAAEQLSAAKDEEARVVEMSEVAEMAEM